MADIRLFAKRAVTAALLALIASCAKGPSAPERLTLSPVGFSSLPGWQSDHPLEAVPALQRSCAAIMKKGQGAPLGVAGTTNDWSAPCADIAAHAPQSDAAARAFFTHWFQPYAVTGPDSEEEGLFTGYYEAELHGSLTPAGKFRTPLYALPDDLIKVDLGQFKTSLRGQKIVGKVAGHTLVPYDNRAEIAEGSLTRRAKPLLWVDDPVDAFFLEVQGSGRVRMTDGAIERVSYEGSNGRAYVAIGRAMADKNLIGRPVTMQGIRAWLEAHPREAQTIMDLNPSYVFFRMLENTGGPIGAEGVALVPERSLAVDPAFVPLGVPLWLDTKDGQGNILQRLMVAQDTGGAIKGAIRGDVFWGAGPHAEAEAGAMQSRGRYYLLLPKSVNVNVES